jgi:hypothetical protein
MSDRCIFLQAEGPGLPAIQALRERYDPLAGRVPPHLTLVFPFALPWAGMAGRLVLERIGPDGASTLEHAV